MNDEVSKGEEECSPLFSFIIGYHYYISRSPSSVFTSSKYLVQHILI